mgnify:CR=1 FL=1
MQLCQYPCQNQVRRFTLEAIQIPIVYNSYGDYDPNGLLYVLEEDSQRIQKEALRRFQQTPPQPYEEVQPLVLRVNRGDTVRFGFRNRLKRDGRIWKVIQQQNSRRSGNTRMESLLRGQGHFPDDDAGG